MCPHGEYQAASGHCYHQFQTQLTAVGRLCLVHMIHEQTFLTWNAVGADTVRGAGMSSTINIQEVRITNSLIQFDVPNYSCFYADSCNNPFGSTLLVLLLEPLRSHVGHTDFSSLCLHARTCECLRGRGQFPGLGSNHEPPKIVRPLQNKPSKRRPHSVSGSRTAEGSRMIACQTCPRACRP